MLNLITRTLRFKVRSESYPWLNAAAVEVNQVFNYCNETSYLAATRTDLKRKWLSGFDLSNLTAGATTYFSHIGADTIQRVSTEHAEKRRAARRVKLRWRVSRGSRRSLGWVPFKAANLKRKGRGIRFCGKTFRVFEAERLCGIKWRQGCFAQDAVGDWWLCLPVEMTVQPSVAPRECVGIDLGIKDAAVTSEGERLEAKRFYRDAEAKLAKLQQRGHLRQAKRLHRRIRRRRQDLCHKFSRRMIDRYQNIFVGDVSSCHPASRDRECRSGLGVEFSDSLGHMLALAGTRSALMLGVTSPLSSWTRDPASTANCCHGQRCPGARLIDFDERGLSRRRSGLEGASWKYCIRAARESMYTKTWSWRECAA
jgi:putative transposase